MLKLYNTETKKKEVFKPIKEGNIGIYQCGPTVYWTQHIGNLRATAMTDLIIRSLQFLGYKTRLVRNYTDVGHLTGDNSGDADSGEDRMEKGAKRENLTPCEIAEKYINIYENDIQVLNILPADVKPKATDNIKEIVDMIQILLNKNFAYTTDLAVYFNVSKAKDYNRLSGQNKNLNLQGAGTGSVNDSNKKNVEDFALWFFKAGTHEKALQFWQSPFKSSLVENGEGFPGWHIECSVMSKKYVGDTLDVHIGGVEHIPVHHTNEIAQSECANGTTFVNYWLHYEHLIANGIKMAKSEGTAFSLAEIKEKGFNPLALRYFYLQSHYRSKQNFTLEALKDAQNGLENLHKQFKALGPKSDAIVDEKYKNDFIEAISDDFNIPKALAITWLLMKDDEVSSTSKKVTLLEFDKVLGLKLSTLNTEKNIKIEIPDEILELQKERGEARKNKDWEKSDELRNKIQDAGFSILDDANGSKLVNRSL